MGEREIRREAVGELGTALRELVDAAVRTEVPLDELAEAAAVATELADGLAPGGPVSHGACRPRAAARRR